MCSTVGRLRNVSQRREIEEIVGEEGSSADDEEEEEVEVGSQLEVVGQAGTVGLDVAVDCGVGCHYQHSYCLQRQRKLVFKRQDKKGVQQDSVVIPPSKYS